MRAKTKATLTRFSDYMIAVGSRWPFNKKTELFSRSNIWSTEADYPLGKCINSYAIVAIKNLFYVFGGELGSNGATKSIASFSTKTKDWKKCGELKQGRSGHSVFIHEGDFVIVGGTMDGGEMKIVTERCTLNEDKIQCTVVKPKISNYKYYPEMIAIPHDYCPK